MNFDYWNTLAAPEKFLEGDWNNPSRRWAADKVASSVVDGIRTMVEVGPGNGVDYERYLSKYPDLTYTGWEGSSNLYASLCARHPRANWVQQPLLALPPKSFDLVYARHVLEHQPSLEPSLPHLLDAAIEKVIVVWYRPPASADEHAVGAAGEHYWTFKRSDVLDSIGRAGWHIIEEQVLPGDGNLGWVLRRRPQL